MSRDSSPTYVHLRQSRLADLFEEFCRPPSSSSTNQSSSITNAQNPRDPSNVQNSQNSNGGGNPSTDPASGMIQIPGSFLPYEEIHLPAHLMPINPEDEDDVVPDMHAAFGIQQALGGNQSGGAGGMGANGMGPGGVRAEERWRDLGLEGLLNGTDPAGSGGRGQGSGALGGGGGMLGDLGHETAGGVNGVTRARREGRRTGLLLMR